MAFLVQMGLPLSSDNAIVDVVVDDDGDGDGDGDEGWLANVELRYDVPNVRAGNLQILSFLDTGRAKAMREESERRVAEVLDWLGLARVADQVAASLPYGAQKTLGMAYHTSGQRTRARTALRRAAELDPADAEVQRLLREI